jgi:hypothetical protein
MATMLASTITMTSQNRIELYTFFLVSLPRLRACLVTGDVSAAFHVAELNSHHRLLHFLMKAFTEVAVIALVNVTPPTAMPSFGVPISHFVVSCKVP